MDFKLVSSYKPQGDQASAIQALTRGIFDREQHQVLLGVTGSGKTFTMAKVIEAINRPTLVMAHNKTLAAQLYHEFKSFFPHNAVEYFVSYYDYYQPEAYVPAADLYIEKESTINDDLDKLRLSGPETFASLAMSSKSSPLTTTWRTASNCSATKSSRSPRSILSSARLSKNT